MYIRAQWPTRLLLIPGRRGSDGRKSKRASEETTAHPTDPGTPSGTPQSADRPAAGTGLILTLRKFSLAPFKMILFDDNSYLCWQESSSDKAFPNEDPTGTRMCGSCLKRASSQGGRERTGWLCCPENGRQNCEDKYKRVLKMAHTHLLLTSHCPFHGIRSDRYKYPFFYLISWETT